MLVECSKRNSETTSFNTLLERLRGLGFGVVFKDSLYRLVPQKKHQIDALEGF
ncbi:unnamed protein product, partial [marine sediment metagenome]